MKILTTLCAWCAFTASLSAQNIPFSADALFYYPFSGSAANQLGSNYALTVNGPSLAADRFGSPNSAYRFDGVNDYAVSAQTLPDAAEFTVAAWIRPESDHVGAIFYDAQFFTPGEDTIFRIQTGRSLYGIADKGPSTSSFATANNAIQTGTWQHVAMSVRSSLITLYVNGVLVASTTAGGNNVGFHSNFYVGGENHGPGVGNFFHGSIDDLVFYRRALSATEILTLANFPTAVSPPNITTQPAAQSVAAGETATFNITATGTTTLSYQWRKDGIALPGATAATLSVTNVQNVNIGEYSVVVSTTTGSTTSTTASLTIPGVTTGLWKGLVAYYPFTGNARDAAPSRLDFQATPTLSTDRLGAVQSAAVFSAPAPISTASLQLGETGFTASFWLRLNKSPSLGGERVLMHGSWNLGAGLFSFAVWGDGHCAINVVDASGNPGRAIETRAGALTTNTWYHIAVTADGTSLNLAINGASFGTFSTSLTFKNAPLILGGDNGSYEFLSGSVDELRIYTRALSSGEILQLYASEAPPAPPTAPLVASHPANQTIVEGESVSMTAVAVSNLPLSYQWRRNDAPIPGATSASLTLSPVRPTDAGRYSVSITNSVGTVTSNAATLTIRPANPGRLANISIRTATAQGSGTLTVGFVLRGTVAAESTTLLTRASGPGLQQFGVTGTLPDPILSLFEGARLIASNDNWGGSPALAATASSVGAFAFAPSSRDAAIAPTLSGSSYTAQAFDGSGAGGVALIELYDASSAFSYTRPRLVNVSARATAGSGDASMIAGFVIRGESPVTVLVRGIGPALTQFGVPSVLANPRLTLYRESSVLSVNDNWGDLSATSISTAGNAVGAFALPSNSLDSAILATLQPGSYTAQVSSLDGTSGIALIEIYEVP